MQSLNAKAKILPQVFQDFLQILYNSQTGLLFGATYVSSHGSATLVYLDLIYEVPRPLSDTLHAVGLLLWKGDLSVAETST
jgi:hypothetical protein